MNKSGKIKILIIDDEYEIRKVLRMILEREGFDVMDAPDGYKGIMVHQNNPVDVIITDIFMPEKEGLETIRELKKNDPDAKIIAISGGGSIGSGEYLPLAEMFGARKTLVKPIRRQELLESVKDVLDLDI